MSEAVLVTRHRNAAGNVRRVKWVPSEREGAEYVRLEEEWSGCGWREVGAEPVTDVEIEASSDLVAGVS